ncbi:MAG TPA: cupin domain-containing protein [Gaiellaceae bacterium]|nr:cupin domain-containing protein [Gaiellaceae bacterium]
MGAAVVNLADARLEPDPAPGRFAFRGDWVREALGGELIGCGLYEFDPGTQLWPYHYHRGNEEWLVVVAGTPTLRTPDGLRALRPGDVVAFPDGEAGAHTLLNETGAVARVAIFSTLDKGSVVYPDSDKVGAGGKYFRAADAVDYWDGEQP